MGEFLVLVIAGMVIGAFLVRRSAITRKANADTMIDSALDLYRKMTIPLDCEKGDNMIYCYNSDTSDFVCQGADIEEIKTNFKARFPDHGSYITHESLHLFPSAKYETDPTDAELKQRLKEMHKSDAT